VNFLFVFKLAPYFASSVVAWSLAVITTRHSPAVVSFASVDLGDQELIVTVSFYALSQTATLVFLESVFPVGTPVTVLPVVGKVYFKCLLSASYTRVPATVFEPQVAETLSAGIELTLNFSVSAAPAASLQTAVHPPNIALAGVIEKKTDCPGIFLETALEVAEHSVINSIPNTVDAFSVSGKTLRF